MFTCCTGPCFLLNANAAVTAAVRPLTTFKPLNLNPLNLFSNSLKVKRGKTVVLPNYFLLRLISDAASCKCV